MRRLRQLVVLQLMAAVLFCQSSCGRLGYNEHARTAAQRPDTGTEPTPDEDAGDP